MGRIGLFVDFVRMFFTDLDILRRIDAPPRQGARRR